MNQKPNDKPASETEIQTTPERYGTDINFARYQIFASKAVRGYRVLPSRVDVVNGIKVTRTVSVGTYRDTNLSLDTDDELVAKAIYGRWERNGCDMENRSLTGALVSQTRFLSGPGEKKPRHIGARDYEKLRTSIDKLARVGIGFDQAYENNQGWSTKQITLLKSVELFNRKDSLNNGGKYFEFSKLELNEDICQNIKDKKIKLFYLDELLAIRGETGRLIYDRLELLGGVVELPFRRDALLFAKECTIDVGISAKVVIRKIRRACKELRKRVLTFGVITDCHVESDKRGKWFFVCHIEKVIATRRSVTKSGTVHVVPDREEVDIAAEAAKERELMEMYAELPVSDRLQVDQRAKEIHRSKFHGYGSDAFAKREAMREHLGLGTLCEDVDQIRPLMARERAGAVYMSRGEREARLSLARQLEALAAARSTVSSS